MRKRTNRVDEKKEIKAIWIKFYDNDFCSAALGAVKALSLVLDLTTAPEEFILKEFKFLIQRLADTKSRLGIGGYTPVTENYFDKCTIESLTYVPKGWYNSETIVYDFDEGTIQSI